MQITKFLTPPNEMRVKYGKTDYSIPNYEGYNPYPSVYTDIDGGNWASLFLFLTHEEANHYMSIITNGYIGVRCSYSLEIKDADLESLPKNYHKCPIPNTKGTDIFTWYVGSGYPDFMASQKDVVSFIRKNIKVETVATVSYCKTLLKVEDEFIIWNKDKASILWASEVRRFAIECMSLSTWTMTNGTGSFDYSPRTSWTKRRY